MFKIIIGGATAHCTISGVSHASFSNDVSTLRATRRFLDFLPLSNDKRTLPTKIVTDPPDRKVAALSHLIPDDPNTPYDMIHVVKQIVDNADFFEVMPTFAENIVIGFARMEGHTGKFFNSSLNAFLLHDMFTV